MEGQAATTTFSCLIKVQSNNCRKLKSFYNDKKIMCDFLRQVALRTLLTIFQQNKDVLCNADKLFNPKRSNVQYTDIITKDTNQSNTKR